MQKIENEKRKMPYNVSAAMVRIGIRYAESGRCMLAAAQDDGSVEEIADYLCASRLQAVLFCGIYAMRRNGKREAGIDDVIAYFGFSKDDGFQKECGKELHKMFRQGLLSKETPEFYDPVFFLEEYGKVFYRPNDEVLNAIKENERYKPSVSEDEKAKKIVFEFIDDFGKMCRDNESFKEIKAATENLEETLLPASPICRLKETLDMHDRVILYELCYMAMCRNTDGLLDVLRIVFPDDVRRVNVKAYEIESGVSPLVRNGFVRIKSGRGFGRKYPKATDKGLEAVFGEDSVYLKGAARKSGKGIIPPSEIDGKELFYPREVQERLAVFRSSMEENNYKALRKRMAERKFRGGVCCLFYGVPGTGKTEGVYQIAKATDRKIYHVDMSGIRGRYVGESEKNTKKIFTRYRKFREECEASGENTPILLLNEADALFAKRLPVEGRNASIQQMENTMQNIILEQMERLDGILIATTNLEESLDDAFERRFLFKVKFPKPDAECRAKIWRSKVPALSGKEAAALAERYDFSGGEIENVARKSLMKNIVTGKDPAFEDFDAFCKEERMERKNFRSIGF